jgi:hypothetical protein
MKKIIAKYIPISQMVRKVNKSLKAWVAFIKKVQKEEKLSYSDAMKRAKVRKDGGEKWMGGTETLQPTIESKQQSTMTEQQSYEAQPPANAEPPTGGKGGNKKQKKTAKKQKGGRRKTCYKK